MTKFAKTYCSQCGGEFGPGNNGFSHCDSHKKLFGHSKKRKFKSKAHEKSYLEKRLERQKANITKRNPVKRKKKSVSRKHAAPKTRVAKRNPVPAYIIRAKLKHHDHPFYFDGKRLNASRPSAEKFFSVERAKLRAQLIYSQFPSVETVGVQKL